MAVRTGSKLTDGARDGRSAGEWLLAVGLAAAALTPFAYAFWYWSSATARFDIPRFAGVMGAGALACVAIALGASGGVGAYVRKRWAIALALVAGVSVLSAALSSQPAQLLTYGAERSYMSVAVWCALCAIGFAAALPAGRWLHRWLLTVVVVGSCGVVVLGAVELQQRGEFSAGLGNGNFAGTVIAGAIPLAVLLLWAARGLTRLLWATALGLLLVGIVLSRSATVAAVVFAQFVVVAACAPQLLGAGSTTARRVARYAAAAAVALAATLFLAWRVVPTLLPSSLVALLDAEITGPTYLSRVEHWRLAARTFAAHPLFGAGPDGLDAASQAVMTRGFVTSHQVIDGIGMLQRDPHSLPVLIAASAGIAGLAAAVFLAYTWGRGVAVGLRQLRGARRDGVALLGLSAVSVFACMLLIPWSIRYGALPALLGGLALAAARSFEPTAERTPSARPGWLRIAGAAGLYAVAVVFVLLGASAWASQSALVRAQSAMDATTAAGYARQATQYAPTRLFAHDRYLSYLGEGLNSGTVSPQVFMTEYARVPAAFHGYAPYEVAVARDALDYVFRFKGPDDLGLWATGLAEKAVVIAPALPEAQVEAARAAIVRGNDALAVQLLDSAATTGYEPERIAQYRRYLAPPAGE